MAFLAGVKSDGLGGGMGPSATRMCQPYSVLFRLPRVSGTCVKGKD